MTVFEVNKKPIFSLFFPLRYDEVTVSQMHPEQEQLILRTVGMLYDKLADSVDAINAVFSKLVANLSMVKFFSH